MKPWKFQNGWKRKTADGEKHRPTLTRILSICQIGVFLLMLLFAFTSIFLQIRSDHEYFRQKEREIVQECIAEARNKFHSHQELLWTLFADTSQRPNLYVTEPGQRYFGKQSTFQDICNICALNPEIGFVFAAKKNGFLISNSSGRSYDNGEIRNYLMELITADFQSVPSGQWNLVVIQGNAYFLYTYHYIQRDLYVGNLVYADRMVLPIIKSVGQNGYFTISDGESRAWEFNSAQDPVSGRWAYQYTDSLVDGLTLSGSISNEAGQKAGLSAGILLLALGLICIVGFLAQGLVVNQINAKPISRLSKQLRDVRQDLSGITITKDAATEEIFTLKSSIRYLLDEVVSQRIEAYETRLREQETQLLILRSQLRPHFYLNAITTVKSMTYQNRNEEIRAFLDALSIQMRYMMRTDGSRITLGEELKHIRAFIAMQEIRYPKKIISYIDAPEELADCAIPHLVISTIVENSFKYSFGVQDVLLLIVQVKRIPDGFCVTIEDNGRGYPSEIVSLYNQPIQEQLTPEQMKHVGLRNVKQTLKLKYGRDGLLRIWNREEGGAVTELTFPVSEK